MTTDSLGKPLEVGDLVLVCISDKQPSIAKIEALTDNYGYINIRYIKPRRNWITRKDSQFDHPYAHYYRNIKRYQKKGEYKYSLSIRKEKVPIRRFTVKLTDKIDIANFIDKHLAWWVNSLNREGQTTQTKEDIITLLDQTLTKLNNDE